jgi:hypothetical protein
MATLRDKADQVGKYLQRSGVMDDERLYLQTPFELLTAGYGFMEVVSVKTGTGRHMGNRGVHVIPTLPRKSNSTPESNSTLLSCDSQSLPEVMCPDELNSRAIELREREQCF